MTDLATEKGLMGDLRHSWWLSVAGILFSVAVYEETNSYYGGTLQVSAGLNYNPRCPPQ